MSIFEASYLGLFLISFLSATILPLSSEAVLIGMYIAGFDVYSCLLIASFGNILGGTTNYWIGRLGNPKWLQKIGVSEQKLNGFTTKIEKYGFWCAALSWVPIIGDPLLVALGFFKAKWPQVFLIMSLSKIIRYIIFSLPWII